jgi:hypothetical protein
MTFWIPESPRARRALQNHHDLSVLQRLAEPASGVSGRHEAPLPGGHGSAARRPLRQQGVSYPPQAEPRTKRQRSKRSNESFRLLIDCATRSGAAIWVTGLRNRKSGRQLSIPAEWAANRDSKIPSLAASRSVLSVPLWWILRG